MQRPVAQKRRTYAGKVEAAAAKAAAARSPEEPLSLPQPKLILGPEPTVEMKRLWVEAAEDNANQTAQSLWSECDLKDRATRILVPSVTAQIERSFAKSKTRGDATTGAVQAVADRQATSLISIITGPRATNLGIAASRLPPSLLDKGSLPRAILNCDSSVITDEILEQLERLEMDDEELQKLSEYQSKAGVNGERRLRSLDRLLLSLALIDRVREKVKTISLRRHIQATLRNTMRDYQSLIDMLTSLQKSKTLPNILKLGLYVSNFLNAGTSRVFTGIKVASILKVRSIIFTICAPTRHFAHSHSPLNVKRRQHSTV